MPDQSPASNSVPSTLSADAVESARDLALSSCPLSEILALYRTHCPSLPPIRGVEFWSVARTSNVSKSWTLHPDLAFWQAIFIRSEASDYLSGRWKSNGWKADFAWILKPFNLRKIISGAYDNANAQGRTGDPSVRPEGWGPGHL